MRRVEFVIQCRDKSGAWVERTKRSTEHKAKKERARLYRNGEAVRIRRR